MFNRLINYVYRTVPARGGWMCVRCGVRGEPGTGNERLRHRCRAADVARYQAWWRNAEAWWDE
jgi:hypothetical protein